MRATKITTQTLCDIYDIDKYFLEGITRYIQRDENDDITLSWRRPDTTSDVWTDTTLQDVAIEQAERERKRAVEQHLKELRDREDNNYDTSPTDTL